ncbi:MAG: hypothetical protein CMN30_12100 [Sandaracinus sp.]|nr:hypothetical protein [Sandaracinus sp.]
MLRFATIVSLLVAITPASAQTVDDIADRGRCSTAGLEGISAQLADSQACLRPGQFVRFAPHGGITLSSSRIHPYLQASARDAVHRAVASGTSLTINSAFRTIADQYVLYHSGGCGLAARPGQSNHQSGRAIDVNSYSSVRAGLERAGCVWLGDRDPVHFDCPGSDLRSDAVLTFQKLWNANNPSDRIAEDGSYGPQTEARLARTPAGGFADDLCAPTCEPGCDGAAMVAADCGRTECGTGLTCADDAAGLRCVDPVCPATGTASVCLDDGERADCVDGTREATETCVAGCVDGECAAVPTLDLGVADAGVMTDDAAVVTDGGADLPADAPGPAGTTFGAATGGCSCRVTGARDFGGAFPLVLLLALSRRRRPSLRRSASSRRS